MVGQLQSQPELDRLPLNNGLQFVPAQWPEVMHEANACNLE
jgi:hypothetical protein